MAIKFYCDFGITHLLFSICVIAATTTAQTRIVGGDAAPESFGLFHASLQNLSGYHVCGGAIVSRWHIVTAAHCVYGAEPEFIKVIVGTTNLNYSGVKYDVESIKIYGKFNFTARVNDIAILKVAQHFDMDHARTISLREEHLKEGDMVFLAGFGAQTVNGESSDQMQVLMLPVFNQTTCRFAMRYTREVTHRMFCTFTKIGQGTCKGDSGSPIIKDNNLVGLVSWGIPCAVGFPDVHTRVAPFIKWIRKEIRNDLC